MLARSLRDSGLSCAIIEKNKVESLYAPQNDNRGIALSALSKVIFSNLGIWQHISPNYAINNIHVSEQGRFSRVILKASSYDVAALGYVVSAYAIAQSIYKDLQSSNIVVFDSIAKVVPRLNTDTRLWHMCIESPAGPKNITGRLLVAADGTNSAIRDILQVKANKFDYKQSAVITNIEVEKPKRGYAYQRIVPDGVLALLPFGECRYKFVLTGDNLRVTKFRNRDNDFFVRKAQGYLGNRLGKLSGSAPLQFYPLTSLQAENCIAERAVLLGNAVTTLHPLGAQGYNLALRDVATLAETILKANSDGKDIASSIVLQQYANLRQKDQNRVAKLIHNYVKLSHSQRLISPIIRGYSRMLIEFLQPFNNLIGLQGMGFNCNLPKLAL